MVISLIAFIMLILFFAACYLAYQENNVYIFWVALVVAVIVGIILLICIKQF